MSGPYNASHKFCPSFLVAAVIFSVFTLTGIVSAAWVDAPNTPPGYGISGSGCTFPCLEEDFRPMNLGATKQTKRGDIAASGYYDADDPTGSYFIAPYAGGGNSGKLDGSMSIASAPSTSLSVGRVEPYLGASAKLIVNNPETAGKYGSTGDAIYAYADSAGAALFAEQEDPLGYAITASGTASYFNSNVEVGSATNPKQLCLSGVCQSTWPSNVWTVSGNDIYNNNIGNVGIGTNTPSGLFQAQTKNYQLQSSDVLGHSTPRCSCDVNNDIRECSLAFPTTDAPGSICYDRYRRDILFIPTNFSARFQAVTGGFVVKGSGNVGIGTDDPQENLHVGGGARIDGPANTCKKVPYTNTTTYQIGNNCIFGETSSGDCDGDSAIDLYDSGYPRPAPAVTTSCGANYYVVGAINASGHFANPATPPQTGSLLCCKNAD